jgi:acetyl esterase
MRAPLTTLAAALALLLLSGCTPTGDDSERIEPTALPVYPALRTYPEIPVIEDIVYAEADGRPLYLDACFPTDNDIDDTATEPRPSIVSIHGGSWMRGDKANLNWRAVCQWLASEGFVAVSVNYRLAPDAAFPAQLDDVTAAVEWLRDPVTVARYDLDPDRIGAFGGSAGGNLAALLGTAGSGDWTSGSRVAAVAELSGPTDIRERIPTTDSYNQDFGDVQLAYTGCEVLIGCPAAAEASPITHIDDTDPPFFIGHSVDEFIPLSQSDTFVTELREAGVPVTYLTVEGTLHSLGMLDDAMQQRIIAFFRDTLSLNAVTRVTPPDDAP